MNNRIIIIMIIGAAVAAVTFAAVYFFLRNRPAYPAGTYVTPVNETLILIESDPENQAVLVETPNVDQSADTNQSEQAGQGGENEESAAQDVEAAVAEGTPVTPTPPPTNTPSATSIPATPNNQHVFKPYTVVSGDTLYSIANKPDYNTTIALMARFGISAPDIVAGNVLQVPVANPAICPGSFPYVIREGDTLYSISIKCNTTVDILKQLNGITGDTYRLDETNVLCVPNQPS